MSSRVTLLVPAWRGGKKAPPSHQLLIRLLFVLRSHGKLGGSDVGIPGLVQHGDFHTLIS